MDGLQQIGKVLIAIGALIVLVGVFLVLAGRVPQLRWFGRLPGDILVKRKNFTFYFPLATSIVISIILTLIMLFLRRR